MSAALALGQSAPDANDSLKAAILTPPPAKSPRINGSKIVGVRPGSPFLYTIAATGDRPLEYSAQGLPTGLKLDAATGQITGALRTRGEFSVTLGAKNALGKSERKLRIVVGDKIALTPPMGWNSWNCWAASVSQEKVLSSAKALVEKGLRDHGWSYINVDDSWQGTRGGPFNAIQPNSKFPNIKALSQQIHSMGLRFGIYSTPWRGTYEGHVGSTSDNADGTYDWIKSGKHNPFFRIGVDDKEWRALQKTNWKLGAISFAEQDAKQWAQWEVDYLKYDWFPNDVAHTEAMTKALRNQSRDIVFSLSNTAPYDSAPDFVRLANVWRTTGDIRDTWKSVSHIGFSQDRWAAYNGPGHWNDPDMLVVGKVGWGPQLHPSSLTPDEQYSHISLWCLLSAPLLIGCDIAQMDEFTVGLLTNDEVIDIDQDPLGKQATQVLNEGDKVVYAKTLEDGSTAVGLFNRGSAETTIAVGWGPWGELSQLEGKFQARDLWRQKDLGVFNGKFQAKVAPHGVVLVRLSPAR
jgi:alpha-galactosidase